MNFPKGKFIDTIYMIADVKSITFAEKKLKIFLKKVEKIAAKVMQISRTIFGI